MYVTIRRYEGVDIAAIRAAAQGRDADEGLAPLISEIPGFVAYYLADVGNGGAVAISVYLDEAEANVSTDLALRWVRDNLASVIPNPPEIIAGDVIVHRAE